MTATLHDRLLTVRTLRRELLRREILDGRIDLLATAVLGYELRPFHRELLEFQSTVGSQGLALAPRGYGKSTVLTIARSVYEVLRNPNIRILIAWPRAARRPRPTGGPSSWARGCARTTGGAARCTWSTRGAAAALPDGAA